MKKNQVSSIIIFLLITFTGFQCSKKQSITPPSTSLKIKVTDNVGNSVAGATVKLYLTQANWQDQSNQVETTKTTDAGGEVLFSNVSPIKYYWRVEKGCQNNVNGSVTSTTALLANTTNTL
ncbi:MAG TPA: carboxypeptidase-like regulatory domain-containing protein, partial [Chitinophagaceae bacterium]|nr:carboxypeptidase-like regulatory domain-containing protein [Chitinophagaceae bacterium]